MFTFRILSGPAALPIFISFMVLIISAVVDFLHFICSSVSAAGMLDGSCGDAAAGKLFITCSSRCPLKEKASTFVSFGWILPLDENWH